jgi:hypothetical protein
MEAITAEPSSTTNRWWWVRQQCSDAQIVASARANATAAAQKKKKEGETCHHQTITMNHRAPHRKQSANLTLTHWRLEVENFQQTRQSPVSIERRQHTKTKKKSFKITDLLAKQSGTAATAESLRRAGFNTGLSREVLIQCT